MRYSDRVTRASTSVPRRLAAAVWRQASKNPRCPDEPRLDGKLALVTGGNGGIGYETCLGLARRGAEVILAARSTQRGEAARDRIRAATRAEVHHLPLDLSDLTSVRDATDQLRERWPGRELDLLIANAGVMPTVHRSSAQGHEMAFATNVLGHYVLARRALASGLLRAGRVVMVTGDIYIRASACTPDFAWKGTSGGQMAYCRSKLGNLWLTHELHRRYPDLSVYAVHPGVIATNLMGEVRGLGARLRSAALLSWEEGAQTSLICATQAWPVRGGYYHNTLGRMELAEEDPAADTDAARALWERLGALAADFL